MQSSQLIFNKINKLKTNELYLHCGLEEFQEDVLKYNAAKNTRDIFTIESRPKVSKIKMFNKNEEGINVIIDRITKNFNKKIERITRQLIISYDSLFTKYAF